MYPLLSRSQPICITILLVWAVGSLLLSQPSWAGEFFSEDVTSPSVEVIQGWKETVNGTDLSITSSSRGTTNVPLEVKGSGCGAVELVLRSGLTQPVGTMENCVINLFPFLDRLINQEIAQLRLTIADRPVEIPLSDNDRLILSRVANQSRQAFLVFQKEVVRMVQLTQRSPSPTVSPEPLLASPAASPAAPLPTPGSAPGSSAELEIVGSIKEEPLGAGSRLSVEAINRAQFVVLSARARFDFFKDNRLVDTRTTAFTPNDVPPGQRATAQVVKTEANWDRVSVTFQWQRP